MATRTARVRSATSPYLSDCMPEERVATQPPSVECVKLSGKWPSVQPRALSWVSRSGPKIPACTRASRERGSISSTRSRRPMSTDTTVRGSPAGASRLPEMFVPPPKGITTASASSAASRTAVTAASSPGRTTTSGTRPMSPRRWRTRSRKLLPRACPTRSAGSVETYGAPTAASSAACSSPASDGSGISRSSKRSARVTTRPMSMSRWWRMNGRSAGLSAWVKPAPSTPQPHHFISGRGRAARRAGACPLAAGSACSIVTAGT